MTYQVLARKYRPQTFSKVVGQEHITKTLQNAIEAKRLHHAYLFTGVRGVGKTTVARILAKAINCEKGPAPEPCNKCKTCTDITNGVNLDVQEIDGASNTGVDDVREIRERLKYLPSGSRYKIYIIDEVHMLSTAAFNALLKTLEEPPPHVIFMFATTEPHKIPATILSRCQRYDFRRVAAPVIIESLKEISHGEGVEVEPDALAVIAGEADGSMRDAQSLFDQAVAFSGKRVAYESLKGMLGFMDRAQLKDILSAVVVQRDAKAALGVVDDVFNSGGNLVRLAQELLEWVRGILILKVTGDVAFLHSVPTEDKEFMRDLSSQWDISGLEQAFRICYRQAEEVSRSKYPKMVLEMLMIQLAQIRPVASVDALIKRVDRLMAAAPKGQQGAAIQNTRIPEYQDTSTKTPDELEAKNDKQQQDVVNKGIVDRDKWEAFLRWLRGKKPQLVSILEHGIFVGGGNGSIDLKYSVGSIYGDMLNESDRKKQLEDHIEKYFSKRYAIVLGTTNEGVPAVEDRRTRLEMEKKKVRRVKEETMSNELVKEAVSILDAEVRDIKVNKIEE